jgi:type IV pilus assembly protein PilX
VIAWQHMSDIRTAFASGNGRPAQRGMVLISSLLLLLIVTIFAISMFRSFGIEERIAGNTRDKERARASALTALQYAEWWVTQGNWANASACPATLMVAPVQGQVCLQGSGLVTKIPNGDVTVVPWVSGGQEVGTTYTPTGMNVTNAAAADYYLAPPRFYISFISTVNQPLNCGNLYQIDAWGYGSSKSTVAEVESVFETDWNNCGANGP